MSLLATNPANLRADLPPNPRPGALTRLIFALCAGVGCVGEWNNRRGYMLCKYFFGERLIEPGNWAVLVLSLLVGAGFAWWASGRLPRRVRPWTLLPVAVGVFYSTYFFSHPASRQQYGYMFWMCGLGIGTGLFCWDQGTFAWLKRKLRAPHRRIARRVIWWGASFALLAGTLFVSIFMTEYSFRLLHDFFMYVYDYSNLNQSMWTLAQFGNDNTIATTMNYVHLHRHEFHWWGEHFTPVQYFILPLYYPFQRPGALSTIMCVFAGLTIPVLLLALRAHLGSWPIAFGLTFAFLFHPVWVQVLHISFHYETFFPFFFFGAYYFYAKRKMPGFLICLLMAFTTKESMPLGVMAWGATTMIFHTGRRRWGLVMFVVAAVYFYVSMRVIVDIYREGEPFATMATRYSHLFAGEGIKIDSMGTLIKSCLRYPWDVLGTVWVDYRWLAIVKVLMPFAFICLLRPWTICIFMPTMLMHVLTDFSPQYKLDIYHAGEILPYCVIATAIALEQAPRPLFRGRQRRYLASATVALLIAVLGAHIARSFLLTGGEYPHLPPVFKRSRSWGPQLYNFLLNIPPDVRVASLGNAMVPLSNRPMLVHYDYPAGDERMLAADSDPLWKRYRHPWEEYADNIILVTPRKLDVAVENEIEASELRLLLPETMHSGEWELARPYDDEMGLLWLRRGTGGIPNADEILAQFFRMEEWEEYVYED